MNVRKNRLPDYVKRSTVVETYTGGTARYFLYCWMCRKPKGRSNSKFCVSCSRKHPKAQHIAIGCPNCSAVIHRDEVIRALYFGGASAVDIGKVFNIDQDRVRVIAYRGRKVSKGA